MDQNMKKIPLAQCYIDDVIIFSDTLEEYIKH